jgi:hypothetical protein
VTSSCDLAAIRYLAVLVRLANERFAKNQAAPTVRPHLTLPFASIILLSVTVSSESSISLFSPTPQSAAPRQARTDQLHVLLAKSLLAAVPNPADTDDAASAAANATPQDEAEADNWVVACAPAEAEQTRAALAGGGYLDTSRRNQRQQDGRIAIPVLAALPPLLLSPGATQPRGRAREPGRDHGRVRGRAGAARCAAASGRRPPPLTSSESLWSFYCCG